MPPASDLLHLLRDMRHRLDDDLSLGRIASRAGWSAFHLHRAFHRGVGETPKRYTLRLRLESSATRLLTSADRILDIALAHGFSSHEVFTRAFRRHYGITPARYRASALDGVPPEHRSRHATLVAASGPCLHLFHYPMQLSPRSRTMPTLSMMRKDIPAQPIVFVRLRPARHELSAAIGEGLGLAFPYAMRTGIAIAGRPFARYLSTGPGLYTVDVGMPIAAAAPGEDRVESGTLHGGAVAVAMHAGSYEQLGETYAALERWIEEHGYRTAGPPWESYITDPADHPDPADWRTEVYWPLV